jgi:HlyD family secretion protein
MKVTLRRGGLVLVGLAVLALLVLAFRPAAVPAETARVARGPMRVTVDHEGRTRIRERYVVSAPLAGQLGRVTLKPGARVEQDKTPLAVIEPTDPALLDERARAQAEARVKSAESQRHQAKANLVRAQAAAELTQRDLARARESAATNSIAPQDLDAAVLREQMAAGELRAAQFAVQTATFDENQAKAALLRTRPRSPGDPEQWRFEIPSPITGKVLRVFQESAAVVAPGTRLLELGDPTDLEVEIDLLSTDAVKVRPGMRVLLEHWGGEGSLNARVRLVEPAGFLKVSALGVEEQRVWVIADLTDPREKWQALGDAYRVEARVLIWEENDVMKVPAGALFRRGGEWAVFRLANGRAELRLVRIGRMNGLEAQVLEGLTEGDEVIVHPSDRIADGTRVEGR